MNGIDNILTHDDIADVEKLARNRIISVRAERRLPPMRPEFQARSAAETLAEAEAADYRWLEESNAVLERTLIETGTARAEAERVARCWRVACFILAGFYIGLAVAWWRLG